MHVLLYKKTLALSLVATLCLVICLLALRSYEFIPNTFSQNINAPQEQNSGLKVKTSIVGACSVGLPETQWASDVALKINMERCQSNALANVVISNNTNKWHKNVEIACTETTENGKMLHKVIFSVDKEIPPKGTVIIDGLPLNALDERTTQVDCAIIGIERF